MNIADPMKAEFEHEATVTRRVLERVPEADFGWKPHPKSFTLAELASHVVQIPGWGVDTLIADEFDFDPNVHVPWVAASREELLQKFDERVQRVLEELPKQSNQQMMTPWSLKVMGQTQFTLPRVAALRTWVFNHLIHHRGQLAVYLRLRDVPVPSIYGPSADEEPAR